LGVDGLRIFDLLKLWWVARSLLFVPTAWHHLLWLGRSVVKEWVWVVFDPAGWVVGCWRGPSPIGHHTTDGWWNYCGCCSLPFPWGRTQHMGFKCVTVNTYLAINPVLQLFIFYKFCFWIWFFGLFDGTLCF
jgi:hypothetical protein